MSPVSFIEPTFAAGEISPSMYARVDLAKYHAGLKLCRNFIVLPHGGISNRAGLMFVGRCRNSSQPIALIPFQFNLLQAYLLEFGHLYMRVIMNGGYVLEPAIAITGITQANPGVITVAWHGCANGDQVYIGKTSDTSSSNVLGMTQINSTPGRQYVISNATTNTFTLTDLDGNAINTTAYTAYSSGGTVARVYTLSTPYVGADVQSIKWTQSADTMTLCHPNYPPMDLTRTKHWNWGLNAISFTPKTQPPTGVSVTPSGPGTSPFNYRYVVTAVTATPPEESLPSAAVNCTNFELNQNTGTQNRISWTAVPGATKYNIYKANPSGPKIVDGAMLGYIGRASGTSFADTNIAPDYTQAPPEGVNPFSQGSISAVTVVNQGSGYPATGVFLTVSDSTGIGAVLHPVIKGGKITAVEVVNGGQGYSVPTISASNSGGSAAGHIVVSHTLDLFGELFQVINVVMTNPGSGYVGNVTASPASGGAGYTFVPVVGAGGQITSVESLGSHGYGYTDGDPIVFSQHTGTSATFTATVASVGDYPSCATYFQQRKVFAGSPNHPQTVWLSQPANFTNFGTSNPSRASDAITFTIAAQQVNAIKWLLPMNDLIIMSSGGAWKLTGGGPQNPTAVTPANTVVVPQVYVGCADLPPIVVNYDILYVQSKGSIVRDLAYNFYANMYTGQDMSILSNHLFFGHTLVRWCYAEEPFKQIWAVRDDGVLLSFTYLKEQDVYAWAHHDSYGTSGTDQFLSVASIPEQQIAGINADSVYCVVQRTIPGINYNQPVKYIERMDDRNFLTNGAADVTKAWFVDCGLQYSGAPATVISGLDHLNGATVAILADGSVQPQQVVVNGSITLQNAASTVTVGLPYVSQMRTLSMEPEGMTMQIQDYRKRIDAVAVRVADTRGLKVGPDFNQLTEIKERGPGVSMGVAIPLFTGDERVVVNSQYLTEDDICIQQDNPLPCTILGVIPSVSIGG